MTSAHANNGYWQSIREWGRKLDGKVAGVCAWAKERGMKDAPC